MKRLCLTALSLALLLSGCRPAPAPTQESPEAAESLPPVYADWSGLTPYEKPREVYTRRYEAFTDALIPAEDYGPLVPFEGAALIRHEYGFDDTYTLYGLTTLAGEVVVDPVFTSAYALTQWDASGQVVFDPGVLLLTKAVAGPDGEPEAKSAVCARDGSWCTDFLYTYDWELLSGMDLSQSIPVLKGYTQIAFLDLSDGSELRVVDIQPYLDLGVSYPWEVLSNIRWGSSLAYFPVTAPDGAQRYYLADLETGTASPAADDVMFAGPFEEGLCRAMSPSGWGCLDEQGRWAIDPVYSDLSLFSDGTVLVRTRDDLWRLLDGTGKFRLELPRGYDSVYQEGGFWKCRGEGLPPLLFQADLTPITLPEGVEEVSVLSGGWLTWQREGAGSVLYRDGKTQEIPRELGQVRDTAEHYALLEPPDREEWYLWNLETEESVLLPGCYTAVFQMDEITGERCIWTSSNELQCWRIFDLEGKLLSSHSYSQGYGRDELMGGLLFQTRLDRSALLTLDGDVVFQWLIPQASD